MDLTHEFFLYSIDGDLIRILSPLSYTITEEINAHRTLELTTDYELEKSQRIVVRDAANRHLEFIVQGVEVRHNADGLFYIAFCEDSLAELFGDFIEDKRPKSATAAYALGVILEGTRWEVGRVQDDSLRDYYFYRESIHEALAKIVNATGLELTSSFEIDVKGIAHRYVNLSRPAGEVSGRRFEWSKDCNEVKKEILREEIYTALYGFGKGVEVHGEEDETPTGFGRRLDFSSINDGKMYVEDIAARSKYGLPSDLGRMHRYGVVVFDQVEDAAELMERTEQALSAMSQPNVSYSAEVESFAKYGAGWGAVGLGDDVLVIDDDIGTVKARVMKLTQASEGYDKVVLGSFRDVYAEDMMSLEEAVSRVNESADTWDQSKLLASGGIPADKIQGLLDEWNNLLNETGGNFRAVPGQGAITMDGDTTATSNYATQIVSGGMRIADSKKADGTWDWTTIATGKGFLAQKMFADKITGRLIEANTITASNIASRTITANEIKSATITAAQIKGGTITAAEIASNTITANEIKSATITADQIASRTITAAEIATDAITARHIRADAITADLIKTGRIQGRNSSSYFDLDSGYINATKGYFSGSITAANISQSTMSAGSWGGSAYNLTSTGTIKTDHQTAYSFDYFSGKIWNNVEIGNYMNVTSNGIRLSISGKWAVFERTGSAWLGIWNGSPDIADNALWAVLNTGAVVNGSDRRLKKNIVRLDPAEATEFLRTFDFYDFDMRSTGEHRIGVIANFFEFSEHRMANLVYADMQDGILGVNYERLNTIGIAAIKDLDRRLQILESEAKAA